VVSRAGRLVLQHEAEQPERVLEAQLATQSDPALHESIVCLRVQKSGELPHRFFPVQLRPDGFPSLSLPVAVCGGK